MKRNRPCFVLPGVAFTTLAVLFTAGDATAQAGLGSPQPGDVLVTNFGGSTISWHDGATGAFRGIFVPTESGLDHPVGAAFGPDGDLYVGNAGTDQVLRFDGASGEPVGVFAEHELLRIPSLLRFGPDGDLYVGTFGGGRILRFGGRTGAFLGVAAEGLVSPIGLVFDTATHLYAASAGQDRIARFDPRTGTHLGDVASGGALDFPAGLDLAPDGTLLAASLESGELLHFALPSGESLGPYATLPDGTQPGGVAVDPSGRVWVSDVAGSRLLRIDERGATAVVVSAEGMAGPEGIAFVPGTAGGGPDAAARITTPEHLAGEIGRRYVGNGIEEFDAVFPFDPGREFLRWARDQGYARRMDLVQVVRRGGDVATLALGGYAELGNAGTETILAGGVWGLFEAERNDGAWQLTRHIPLDRANRVLSHALDVRVDPERGLHVLDTLDVAVGDTTGFAIRLIRTASIESLTVDGERAPYAFGGGLLWIDTPPAGRARIALSYTIDVARDSTADPNTGRFEADYGHVRNQYVWHPFFDFGSEADLADIRLTVRVPTPFRVATDLPQREVVSDGTRIVRAAATRPTKALSLWYDRRWQPVEITRGDSHLVMFVTPDFDPPPDSLARAFDSAYGVLAREFGGPASAYLAIVQDRSRRGAGWLFRSNEAIAAPVNGGLLVRPPPAPRAIFGHEVAHGWTRPTGPGANFLREGWATFAEATLLEMIYGPDGASTFWESQRNNYETRGFDGHAAILDDPHNSGVAYAKGAWILRMLRDWMGSEAFLRGMRDYMAIPAGEAAGVAELEAALSRAWGRDVSVLLRPWLEEATIPDVTATLVEERVVVMQSGPVFRLPLELEIATPGGPIRRTLDVAGRVTHVEDVPADATDVIVDPDHRLLLKRHRGEWVRFAVEAPNAGSVALVGDFTARALPAERADGGNGLWSVTIPLTAGTYAVGWRIDGKRREPMTTRTVHPAVRVEDAYPHE